MLFFTMFSFISAHAQYESLFGDIHTSWNIKHEQLFGIYTDSLVATADTSIDGSTWKKLAYYSYFDSQPLEMEVYGYLKEDTTAGKAWYFSSVDTNKHLIMDMSLNVGDSFQLANLGGGAFFEVDSVYYEGGKKHVQLETSVFYANEKFRMIEGVGTNVGIRYTHTSWPGVNPYLLCYNRDAKREFVNYSMDWEGVCNTTELTDVEDLDNVEVAVYPNPVREKLHIKLNKPMTELFRLELFNTYGECAVRKDISRTESSVNRHEIDVSRLSPGIYYVRLLLSKNLTSTYKIIKITNHENSY